MDLELLVSQMTRTILRELQATHTQKTVVLLASKEQALPEGLTELIDTDARILHAYDSWQHTAVDRFLLPCLHIDQMVDLAIGKGGSRLMYTVRQVLLAGKQVEVFQYEYHKHRDTAPHALISLYENYKKQLEGFGLIDCIRHKKAVLRIEKNVLVEADILKAKEQGIQQLELSATCHVTPLAYEIARDIGIQISKNTGGAA